jgi:hypothetical protein
MVAAGAYEFMRREAEKLRPSGEIPQPVKQEYAIGSMEWLAQAGYSAYPVRPFASKRHWELLAPIYNRFSESLTAP